MNFHKLLLGIRSIPKTLLFNFRYFPIKDAIKIPIIVSHRVAIQKFGGKVIIDVPIETNMIHLGFHENPAFDRRERAVWHNTGTVIFEGKAYIGNGNCIANTGVLKIGNNVQMSGNSKIVCMHDVSLGDDVLIGWGCLFMDGDAHKIYEAKSVKGGAREYNRPIVIDNHVWFGANCTVIKGVHVAAGCVVAANSCVTKSVETPHCIIAGYPAKIIREDIEWQG